MNKNIKFELNKKYIVDVTESGIVPVEEFNSERYFDKDNDPLDFLTDEEKRYIMTNEIKDIKKKIEPYCTYRDNKRETLVVLWSDIERILDEELSDNSI